MQAIYLAYTKFAAYLNPFPVDEIQLHFQIV
jgi:hypothetical protein